MEKIKLKETTVKKKKVTMSAAGVEYKDLCTTCNCLSECDSTNEGRRPVHYCEQFDDYVPQKPAPKSKKTTDIKHKKPDVIYKGICINCDFRETCLNAASEGGIWHCEEYR